MINTYTIDITEKVLKSWQNIVTLMAKTMNVPAGLIMRVHRETIEVFAASETKGNVYKKGASEELDSGLYCEEVIEKRQELMIPNALLDPKWDHNPDIKLGMISYLGLPLEWPNGDVFGTICVLDIVENQYSKIYRKMLKEFQTIIELSLQSIYEHELLEINKVELEKKHKENKQYIDIIDRNVLVARTDLEGKILDISQAFVELWGFPKKELVGRNYKEFLIPESESFVSTLADQLDSDEHWRGEMKFRKKNNQVFYIRASIDPWYDPKGVQQGYTAICKDITDKRRWQELSIRDELTGLYNRRYFNSVFSRELNQARRDGKIFALFIIDIDNFKLYNDTYGHDQGDRVLESISEIIAKSLKRANDFAFRIGGEEFAGLLKLERIGDVEIIVERIRQQVEEAEIRHETSNVCPVVTVSIGVKCIDFKYDIETSLAEMYREADAALYLAKESGKNKYLFATT